VRGAGGDVGHESQPAALEPAEAARSRVSEDDFIRAASTRLAQQPIDGSPCPCAEYAEFDVAVVRAHHLIGPCQVLAREIAADLVPQHRAGVAAAARHALLRCEGEDRNAAAVLAGRQAQASEGVVRSRGGAIDDERVHANDRTSSFALKVTE
jgi:hypothetical protein